MKIAKMQNSGFESSYRRSHSSYRGSPFFFVSPSLTQVIRLVFVLTASFASEFTPVLQAADGVPIDPDVAQAQAARVKVMKHASAATISVFGLAGGGGGSGVIISPDGYALTNYHVSSSCGDHMRCGLNDGKLYDATIVGIDATGDLSLIKLLGRNDFPTAPLADSSQVRIGDWCFAAGNPFVLATNLQPSVSLGMVSGVNRYQYPAGTLLEYADCIQTDAAINPGNSGGPLFNMRGEVIGINGRCSFEKRGRVNVGVGYAISANQAKYFLGVLKSGRLVDHATLGATVSTDDDGDVVVSNILSTSDAYRRGLRYGDVVEALAGREVTTTNTFKNILGTLPKGWRVPITLRRNGERQTVLVRLEAVHSDQELLALVSAGLGSPPPTPPPEKETEDPEETAPAEEAEDTPGVPDVELFQANYQAKKGYANYHFNTTKVADLWKGIKATGDYSAAKGTWKLRGTLGGEKTSIEITLEGDKARLQLGSRNSEFGYEDAVSDIITQRRESSLAMALRGWREFVTLGPNKLGDSVYLGTYPTYLGSSKTLAEQPLHPVVQTLWYDARLHCSFFPDTGKISLVEVFGDEGDDPAELYLADYKDVEVAGEMVSFPHRLRLQFGDEPILIVDLTEIELGVEAQDGKESN